MYETEGAFDPYKGPPPWERWFPPGIDSDVPLEKRPPGQAVWWGDDE